MGNEEEYSSAENFRRFSYDAARGRSTLYEEFTAGVAEDRELLGLLDTLAVPKRQPNLLLAAVRVLFGTPGDYPSFRGLVLANWDEVSSIIRARRTQTNEVARCATLLPALLSLPQPLALFEVGASAGLCLLADRYQYDYGFGTIGPADSPVVLRSECRGSTLVPDRVPEVAWRAGCDLEPVDVNDAEAVRWLEALVWPGEGDRLARLRGAVEVARDDPPRLTARDLREGISDLVSDAPEDATLVVFHSAVLTYVPSAQRGRFVEEVTRLSARWIANEGVGVVPGVDERLSDEEKREHRGDFLLSLDHEPHSWTDPHGSWVQRR